MFLSSEIGQRIKEYYAKEWERTEKLLASRFNILQLNDVKMVEEALLEVKKKYPIQGVKNSFEQIAKKIADLRLKQNKPINEIVLGQLIDRLASSLQRYELSLITKFFHFYWPNLCPPFDKYAFDALCMTEVGPMHKLKRNKHPRNSDAVTQWLKAFKCLHAKHKQTFTRIRNSVVLELPKQDSEFGKQSITTYKICDKALWLWGR